jgi:hypothetical protein
MEKEFAKQDSNTRGIILVMIYMTQVVSRTLINSPNIPGDGLHLITNLASTL